jgi:hypothetical protein
LVVKRSKLSGGADVLVDACVRKSDRSACASPSSQMNVTFSTTFVEYD